MKYTYIILFIFIFYNIELVKISLKQIKFFEDIL